MHSAWWWSPMLSRRLRQVSTVFYQILREARRWQKVLASWMRKSCTGTDSILRSGKYFCSYSLRMCSSLSSWPHILSSYRCGLVFSTEVALGVNLRVAIVLQLVNCSFAVLMEVGLVPDLNKQLRIRRTRRAFQHLRTLLDIAWRPFSKGINVP